MARASLPPPRDAAVSTNARGGIFYPFLYTVLQSASARRASEGEPTDGEAPAEPTPAAI